VLWIIAAAVPWASRPLEQHRYADGDINVHRCASILRIERQALQGAHGSAMPLGWQSSDLWQFVLRTSRLHLAVRRDVCGRAVGALWRPRRCAACDVAMAMTRRR
jgi:hypothetical protein